MSRRFGRNRRRALREQVEGLQMAHQLDRALQARMRREIDALRREIDRAAAILGPNSAAFNPRAYSAPKGRDVFYLSRADYSFANSARTHTVALPVLAARVGAADSGLHARLTYDGKAWGYAMSREAIEATPPDLLAERIAHELASQVASQVADDLKRFYK